MNKFKTLIVYTVIVSILLTITALVSATALPGEPYDFDYAVSSPGNVRPTLTQNSNTPNSMPGLMSFKKDDGAGFDTGNAGSYIFNLIPDGSKQIKIWLAVDADGKVYISKWEAVGIQVMYFLVKGSNDYFTYNYGGSLMTDGHLYTPRTFNQEKNEYKNISQISHFTIFFRDPIEETTSEATTFATSSEATTEATTIEETTSEATTFATSSEATTEATTIEETTTQVTTSETSESSETSEPTTVASTTEATTAASETSIATETTIVETTSAATTTAPSGATVTNATTINIQLTTESIPLASVTTTQPSNVTATVVTSTIPLTTLTNPDIPQTGENGSNSGLAIGLILLLMAAGLTIVVFRSRAVKVNDK